MVDFIDTSAIVDGKRATATPVKVALDALNTALNNILTGSVPFTSINVDGGVIDGAVIGATTPANVTGTIIRANTRIVILPSSGNAEFRMFDATLNGWYIFNDDASSDKFKIAEFTANVFVADRFVISKGGGVWISSSFTVETEAAANIHYTQYGSNGALRLERALGTAALPTAIDAGGRALGVVAFRGYTGSGFASSSEIRGISDESFSGTQRGGRLEIWTTPMGSTTTAIALTVMHNRSLKLADVSGAPTAAASSSHIYSQAGEMKVMDAAGNVTTISPHNPQFVKAEGRVSDYVHKEHNIFTGDNIELDIWGALELIEEMWNSANPDDPRTLIHVHELPDAERLIQKGEKP